MGALWQWTRRWLVIIRLGNGQMGGGGRYGRRVNDMKEKEREEEEEVEEE